MITYIDPETRYSDATIHNGIIYLSGQVPEDSHADMSGQTRSVLTQIDTLLARLNSDKAHILEATIYLADMQDYDAMNREWDVWTAPNRAPARACIQAPLADPDWKIEIKLTAVQKSPRD
ncbi:MAG: RidA family protein [Cardiobacteriaceae bacterium]|nr:RidA family protein [Cardiobacteriaceae bacterium]